MDKLFFRKGNLIKIFIWNKLLRQQIQVQIRQETLFRRIKKIISLLNVVAEKINNLPFQPQIIAGAENGGAMHVEALSERFL